MHSTIPLPLLVLASSVLGFPIAAQTFKPVPAYADAVDGHEGLDLPFGLPAFRTQILVDASHVATTVALLDSISFRADRWFAPATGTQVPNVTVRLSQTSVAAGGLSNVFANNVTGTATVVFQGTVTLPTVNVGFAGPMPWNIVIPFSQAYSFTTVVGNLLIDIAGNNPISGSPNYSLDAVQAGGTGTQFGFGGQSPTFDNLLLYVATGATVTPRLLSPGNTIDFSSTLFFSPRPGVVALGTAAQPVPIDLGPFGAPTNFLFIDPLVMFTHSWTQIPIGWLSTFSLPVPLDLNLIGTTLYGQSVILEPQANPLGLIFSPAVEARIGDQYEVLPLQQVDSSNPASATGTIVNFGTATSPEYGAVAIRLGGQIF
jgi:hypothetical protein